MLYRCSLKSISQVFWAIILKKNKFEKIIFEIIAEMDDQLYEINVKRFIQSTEYQLKKLNECITRLNEVVKVFV